MARVKTVSIAQMGGLENYLEQTRHLHNDLLYPIFKLCVDSKVSRNSMGRLFRVHPLTIKKWIAVYNEEARKK